MRTSVSSTFKRLDGIVVISKGSADPLFSTIPAELGDKIRDLEGIRAVAPEIWGVAVLLDGTSPLTKGWFSAVAYGGFDPALMSRARGGGLYAKAMEAGRFLREGDGRTVVLSRKLAAEYRKKIGDSLNINGVDFKIVGTYHTGSMFLDQSLLIMLEQARMLLNKDENAVSTFYVETDDPSEAAVRAYAARIEGLVDGVSAKTKFDWNKDFGNILGNLDAFFSAQSAYIAVLGVVIVLLTMTMSVMERTREFGILKAVGWTRSDVMKLVILEAVFLGGAAGVMGCGAGILSAAVLGSLLPYKPIVPPLLVVVVFGGGVFLGLVGGLYPAYRASSLNPVEAIRTE
jgi:putative ABC transport system permease protein